MLDTCRHQEILTPKFEELDHFFRVTLYPKLTKSAPSASWQEPIFQYLQKHKKINAKVAQEIWNVTRRTTTNRHKGICQEGLLAEISTNSKGRSTKVIQTYSGHRVRLLPRSYHASDFISWQCKRFAVLPPKAYR